MGMDGMIYKRHIRCVCLLRAKQAQFEPIWFHKKRHITTHSAQSDMTSSTFELSASLAAELMSNCRPWSYVISFALCNYLGQKNNKWRFRKLIKRLFRNILLKIIFRLTSRRRFQLHFLGRDLSVSNYSFVSTMYFSINCDGIFHAEKPARRV